MPDAGRADRAALTLVRVAAPLGAAALTLVIGAALAGGAPLGAEGRAIGALAWGWMTFVDLGLALVLGWGWIAWREARWSRALLWLVLTTVTGSVALLGYLGAAAWRAEDLRGLLLGPRRG